MKTFVLRLTPDTIAANQDSIPQSIDEQIVILHRQGIARRKIEQALQVTEYHVRRVTKGVPVEKAQKPSITPFERAVEQCYPLAISPNGLKDCELRDILFRVYGSEWNAGTGRHDALYNDDHVYRVRKRIRELAAESGEVAIFPMDWFNTDHPIESNHKIRQCAIGLAERVQDAVDEYMSACSVELLCDGTPTAYEGEQHRIALLKQSQAARLHVLKLAIPEVGSEPISVLIERAEVNRP
ncbi:hypothetical protein [Pseudomonas sp. UMAB-40]|uniref:hypothetical protein n=1 Tax=Pseudomonas sp. UMAB-40 TaxID=1365407 RepID=UPI001C56C836|nr:hypothetical protein [Pseudomonas sp. UMAB-40]